MNEHMIAELFASIGFKVDPAGLLQAKALFKGLEKQATATGKAMQDAFKGIGVGAGKNIAQAQQALSKAEANAHMQGAKLAKVQHQGQHAGVRTQREMVRLQQEQAKLAGIQAATQGRINRDSLHAAGQALGNQLKQLNIADRIAASQRKAQADAIRHHLLQHKLNRAQSGNTGRHITGRHGSGLLGHGVGAVHRFGGVGNLAGRVAAGGAVDGLGALSGGLAGAAGGLGAVAGSAVLVVAAFAAVTAAAAGFAREAERAANTRNERLAQFKTVGDKTDANSQRMNDRFENFAQQEGFSTKALGGDYSKVVGALAGKVGVDQAADTAEGIFRYGRAQHLSNENLAKISLGMRQALGKGQLYSEEWTGQISEHLGAHANELGAEAWQRAIGGKLTGDAALQAFVKDRGDKKIRGSDLTQFFVELGKVMNKHANDGGLLTTARNTQAAWDNRISNQYQANMARTYDESGLKETMPDFYQSLVKALNELQPEFVALGSAANAVMQGFTGLIQSFTKMMAWFNDGSSYLDPKFMKDFGAAFSELGVSFKALFHTLFDNGGITGGFDILKATLETVVGVVSTAARVLATLVDVFTAIFRTIQDGEHAIGIISDSKYEKILEQRAADDKQRADIQGQDQEKANTPPVMPAVGPDDKDHRQPDAPWRLTDNSDIPTVPAAVNKLAPMASPPITAPQQPAVNGQAVNNVSNNVTITIGETHITATGTDDLQAQLDAHLNDALNKMQQVIAPLSPAKALATQTRARGN
ncbi:hypothetical protein ACIPZ5_17770 [Pseudomonas sp. NPDC089428]|uniref:hypothetical protein n=1 Tax=Pseudomonas sp. NPDC089428 TaxID=3364467 RepID=UPI003809BBDC